MQKNWIGKSFGCEIDFQIQGYEKVKNIKCYTTRPDTLYGMSFLAISVDHPISKFYENDQDFLKFKEKCSNTGTTEEAIAQAEKLGFKTKLSAINPLDNKNKVPVYFANFVLMDYGFGAVFMSAMIKEIMILRSNTSYQLKLLLNQKMKKIITRLPNKLMLKVV